MLRHNHLMMFINLTTVGACLPNMINDEYTSSCLTYETNKGPERA